MSVQTEIDRIISAVEAAHNKILEKGGTTERPYTVAGLEQAIGTIPNAVVQPLEVTENGTYTAPDGVDGYSPVTVNVAASGGGSVETCTLKIINEIASKGHGIFQYAITRLIDGVVSADVFNASSTGKPNSESEIIFTDVICNSGFAILCAGYSYAGMYYNGLYMTGGYDAEVMIGKMTTSAGGTGVIQLYDDE